MGHGAWGMGLPEDIADLILPFAIRRTPFYIHTN